MKLAWGVFMVFVFFDTTQNVAMSAIRASGRQKLGAIMTACAFFALGIPATLLFVFSFDLGIKGIWIGPTLSVLFLTIAYQSISSVLSWEDIIEETIE